MRSVLSIIIGPYNLQTNQMKHPFQHVLLDHTGKYFFAAAINSVFLFNIENGAKLLGSWTDEVDPYYTIRKHHKELLEQYEQQQKEKSEKEVEKNEPSNEINENNKRNIVPTEHQPSSTKQVMNKLPKLPLPGPGAPPTYTYIRDMRLSRDNKHLIITTDNDKAVVVFKINYNPDSKSEVFQLIKRQPMSKRPSAITTSLDDSKVIISDKFGDVYSIDMIDPTILNDKELIPILGHVSMLTCVENCVDENGNEVIFTADRDEHIKISYFPKCYVIKKFLFGHNEFVSSFILPKWCNNKILISGGGDSFICSWEWQNDKELSELKCKLDIADLVKDKLNDKHLVTEKFQNDDKNLVEFCISKMIPINATHQIAVIFERVPSLFIFDLSVDGDLSFNYEFKLENDIITAACSDNLIIVSTDNMEKSLQFIEINEAEKSLSLSPNSDELLKSINSANDAVIGNIDELIPLFNTNYLRKRREH